ncbi:mitochondrial import protein Pam17 [Neolentinus lepideus HHB14362 ss-1]|uniref:Presequence translocated-associated motor subunit PAM17 n=1 Tax=Neolentinus lepideus HHB14362 ss-1 TaxID=1314782 RepID=A0A165TXJ8_9AGAM|nr:mitochondrial import protein Pam17 [Neolentinus lepideus HHB14362 ss-1]
MNCSRSLRLSVLSPFTFSARTVLPKATVRHKSAATVSASAKENLSWPEYLAIRKGKRRWETAVTIPSTFLGFAGGILYFGNLETDASKPIMGIDPFFFYGFATLGCAGLGYLIGPTIGSAAWRTTHRRTMALIEARDREFHKHIVKNRVDPTAQTATNPVPDFYGEKIGSLYDYRQWLRDQARYKRKAEWPEDA